MKFLSEKRQLAIQEDVKQWLTLPSPDPLKDIQSFLHRYKSVQEIVYVASVLCVFAKYPE